MVRRKKRTGILRRSLLLALGVVLFLIIVIYVFFGIYFRSHFFYQTSIEDVDVGGKTAEQAVDELRSQVRDYLLTIYDRDGNQYQIVGTDIEYDYKPMGEEEKLVSEQKSFLWPGKIAKNKKLSVDKSISYDEDLLREEVMSFSCLQEENMKKPKDATIEMTDNGYELIPEEQGNYLIADKTLAAVKAVVEAGETEFTFTDDLYEKPKVTSDDELLKERITKIQSFLGQKLPMIWEWIRKWWIRA